MPDIDDFIQELESFELEYIDEFDQYHSLNSYIKRVEDDFILIDPPVKKKLVFTLLKGTDINLVFKSAKGVCSAQSYVIGRQLTSPSGLKISFPCDFQITERREFVRVPLPVSLEITKYLDSSRVNIEKTSVQLCNVSAGGLCYKSDKPLGDYYDVEASIYLEGIKKEPLTLRCEYIYTNEKLIKNKPTYHVSLAFSDISEKEVTSIVKECFKYQLSQRKMG